MTFIKLFARKMHRQRKGHKVVGANKENNAISSSSLRI